MGRNAIALALGVARGAFFRTRRYPSSGTRPRHCTGTRRDREQNRNAGGSWAYKRQPVEILTPDSDIGLSGHKRDHGKILDRTRTFSSARCMNFQRARWKVSRAFAPATSPLREEVRAGYCRRLPRVALAVARSRI